MDEVKGWKNWPYEIPIAVGLILLTTFLGLVPMLAGMGQLTVPGWLVAFAAIAAIITGIAAFVYIMYVANIPYPGKKNS